MSVPALPASAGAVFRRAFLWTLAVFAALAAIRARANDPIPAPPVDDTPALRVVPADSPPAEQFVPPLPMEPSPVATPAVHSPEGLTGSAVDGIPGASVAHFPQENWTVTIIPRADSPSDEMRRRYQQAYASVPYSLTEYLASPGYRHEATMELMFNQLRPKTVVSHYQPRTVPTPVFTQYKPYMYSRGELYNRWYPSLAPYSFGFPIAPYYPLYPRHPVYY